MYELFILFFALVCMMQGMEAALAVRSAMVKTAMRNSLGARGGYQEHKDPLLLRACRGEVRDDSSIHY